MTHAEYAKHADAFLIAAHENLLAKNRKYSTDGNPHANFDETADFMGVDRRQALVAGLHKHYRTVTNAIKRGENIPEDSLIDLVGYATILYTMEQL